MGYAQEVSVEGVLIDVDGDPGARGRDGMPGHDAGGWSGADGHRGNDAGRAEAGERGGMIDVRLRGEGASYEVSGVAGDAGRRAEPLGAKIPLDGSAAPEVVLRARGGKGGDGGHGGRGGNGARGYAGDDATEYRSGTNGGRGGDGGDGGRGSDGAPGGDGGQITVRVAPYETYLLMAVRGVHRPDELVVGGDGGARGAHGRGGSGGSGGPGGSSYSWTEYETREESYMDSEGNWDTRTVTVSVQHSNPGGWSGPNGSDGFTPNTPIEAGRHGAPGRFAIVVEDQPETRYTGRYDLIATDFRLAEHDEEYPDGIFEYGEVVRVVGVRLRNVGAMPSPAQQRARVTLALGRWVQPLTAEVFLDRSLAPGEEAELPGELAFRIPQPTIDAPGEPLIAREAVRPHLVQLGPERAGRPAAETPFQRPYTSSTLTRALVAQFPVANKDGIIALRSLSPGERTRLAFDVGNVSLRPIGGESERHRRVGVQIEILTGGEGGGDLGAGDVLFEDAEGVEHALDGQMHGFRGYFIETPQIEAQRQAHISGVFGLREHVPNYTGARLRVTLWVEDLHQQGEWVRAQLREITIRAETSYTYDPDSRVVLVTNDRTSQEAYNAWATLLQDELELPFAHWSIGRYGHFDQQVDLEDGTTLRAQLEDRMVLVLNHHFHPTSTHDLELPSDYLKGQDFREGATTNNTHMLVVGSSAFDMQQWLEPTSDWRSGGDTFPDARRFLAKEAATGGPLVQELFKEDITTYVDEVALHTWTFFSTPGPEALEKAARELMDALAAQHPNRRYVLVMRPEDAPERDGRRWLLFPRWRLGVAEVRRTLNTETSSGVVLRASDEEMNTAAFIHSARVRYALILALPFEDKLDLLNRALRRPEGLTPVQHETGLLTVRAILTDLSEELSALGEGDAPLTAEVFEQKLSNLGRLLRQPFDTDIKADAERWQLLIELCAQLQALAGAQNPWWKLWGRRRKMGKHLDVQLRTLKRELFDAFAVDEAGDVAMDSATASARIDARAAEITAEIEARRERLRADTGLKVTTAFAAADLLEHPAGFADHIDRDIDTFADPNARIWTADRFAAAQAAEAERATRQAALLARNASTRADMLVPQTAQEVVLDMQRAQQAEQVEVEVTADAEVDAEVGVAR